MWTWSEICAMPQMQDIPCKVETDEHGKIIMAPVKVRHSGYAWEILILLHNLMDGGKVLPECAVTTPKGVKSADVAWCSLERWSLIKDDDAAHIAPEICVEVMSESNTVKELELKCLLYLQQGADEAWICDLEGNLRFFNQTGEVLPSEKVPKMPNWVGI
jgi:Uma2 family endonuclease